MAWLLKFFTSSIGQKLIMSLTGLFLCSFLLVHCAGNMLLFVNDEGASFNTYAQFMSTNPVVSTIAWGLYLMILVHAIKGLLIWGQNLSARGSEGYAVKTYSNAPWWTKNMAILGSIIFVFIGIHMSHFWYSVKFGEVGHDAFGNEDLYTEVRTAFQETWIVVFYVISCIALAFHLIHGFGSAFQTLGINHSKYTPFIKGLGVLFAVVVCALFCSMPIYFYFFMS